MSLFTDWNNLLLSEYFSPAPANEEVWIQASRNELDSFGLHLGGADGLIQAAKLGPGWLGPTANCADAARRLANQRMAGIRSAGYQDPGAHNAIYHGLKAPAYLPYLALWVLASSEADEGFYARVGSLLDRPFPNIPPLTADMEAVWKDLEHWATSETGGRFGVFRVHVLGEHRFVGIPRSQCMVSRKDVNGVRQLFAACHLRPRQDLSATLLRQILELGADAYYLSIGLRHAMQNPAYHGPLARLLGSMLETWDGRPPRRQGGNPGQGPGVQAEADLEDEATVKLAPSTDDSDGWEIRWRFPASGRANACTLVIDDSRIPSRLEPSGGCFTSTGTSYQEACRSALARSADAEVQVRAEYDDEVAYEVGGGIRASRIAKSSLRILVWDAPDPRLGEELVERDLPISGPLYLLCSSNYRNRLGHYLKNEEIANEQLPTAGLPSGWVLTCIADARRLSWDHRYWLTDGNALPESGARIRFVGGRPIIRAGAKVYAFYDLPILELEAPHDAVLCAEGLVLEEFGAIPGKSTRSPIRRFRIQGGGTGRAAFEIKAMRHGEQLGAARLRVSVPEGAGVGDLRPFGLDCFGRSVPSEEGLRGAVISGGACGGEAAQEDEQIVLSKDDLQGAAPALPQETIAAKFLDSLAQVGSMAYGAARDQVSRLAGLEGPGVLQPALLFMELRSRGHLEIQTDSKGHMVRMHAVPPTLYSLPARHDGLRLFGVCGSLRLQHWEDLINNNDCLTLIEGQPDRLPVVRLAAADMASMQMDGRMQGFLTTTLPGDSISKWAGSLEQATSELSSWGWESFSANVGQLQRLHPASAQFKSVADGAMTVEPKIGRQLFRLDDPSVPGLQVYVLGSIQTGGARSFSFIHDSRWGVWISVSAFAAMLKADFSIDDASPWPIHYDMSSRAFWLPARLKPPLVIERALTLCSGSGPLEVQVSGALKGGHTDLFNAHTGAPIGAASPVYEGLVPGVWLCYRWVPSAVAERVARLLGGQVRPFFTRATSGQAGSHLSKAK